MSPILASYLTHFDFAILGYFNSFSFFALPILSFSLFSYYSKCYFSTDENHRSEILQTLLLFQLIVSVISITILLIGLKIYFLINRIDFPFYPYAILTFGTILFQNIITFYTIELKLKRNAKKFLYINITAVLLINLSVFVLVVFFKKGAIGNMLGISIGTILVSFYCFFNLIKIYKINFKIVKEALMFSWPLVISAILTYFFSGFDKILLENIHNIKEFGLYNVAFKISMSFMLFSRAIGATFEPDFYRAISNNNMKMLIRIFTVTNLIKIIPVVLFLIFGDYIVGLLTNFKYTEASKYAKILIFSNITQAISFSLSTVIIASGFTSISLIEKIIGSIIAIFTTVFLINKFEYLGASWANVLSYFFMIIVSLCFLIYLYKKKLIFYNEEPKNTT